MTETPPLWLSGSGGLGKFPPRDGAWAWFSPVVRVRYGIALRRAGSVGSLIKRTGEYMAPSSRDYTRIYAIYLEYLMRGIPMLALSRLAKLATNAFFGICG